MTYDLLLINTHRQYGIENSVFRDWLGVYLLASYMEQNGYPSRVFAGFAHELPSVLEAELAGEVKVVGFTCDYENQTEVAQFARLVRERWHLPVIVGGPQAVALGADFLQKSGAVAIVRGEGELPLLALMQFLVDGSGQMDAIPGIVYLINGKECCTPLPQPIANLDALPFINPALALGPSFQSRTISILTARGCPFRCAFCYEGGNTRSVRWRSVANVMAELRQRLERNHRIRFVLFTDDTFTLNHRRLREFCEKLSEYRRERDFCWFAEAHPQTILHHPELLSEMVSAGLGSLQIGVESGNEDILRAYNKKTTPAIIEQAVTLCREAGIPHVIANIIVGGAFETEESIARSKAFGLHLLETGAGMLELHAIFFWPLPNTAMTLRPQDYGMEILDPQSKTSVTDYPVVCCDGLVPETLSGLRADMDAAFKAKIVEIAGRLSVHEVGRILHYWHRYGLYSEYVNALLRINRYRRFTELLHEGAICRQADIPTEEIAYWHPQRQCQPLTIRGHHFAEDAAIDESMYRVLVASSGRMTVDEAAKYCGMSLQCFLHTASRLENMMALGFCRY